MGQVYKARDLRLSREVALKIVRTDVPADKASLLRFADEARAASLLSHPNIVAVYDIGDRDGSPYIISELLQGETLRDRLATGVLSRPQGDRLRYPDPPRPRRGPRQGDRPPGPEAREPVPDQGRPRQDPRLRHRQAGPAGRRARRQRRGDPLPHDTRNPDRNRRVHVPRAGAGPGRRPPLRPLRLRRRALRDAHRQRAFKGTTVPDTLSAILREDPTGGVRQRIRSPRRASSASSAVPSRKPPRTVSRPLATWRSPSREPPPSRPR